MLQRLFLLFCFVSLFSLGMAQTTPSGWFVSYSPTTICAGDSVCFTLVNINNPPPGPVMQAYAFLYLPGSPSPITLSPTGNTYCTSFTNPGIYNAYYVVYQSPNFDTIHFPLVIGSVCPGVDVITGIVYLDSNGNGSRDTSEAAQPGRLVQLNPGGLVVSTNSAGAYSFVVPAGSYTVSVLPPAYLGVTQPVPNSYSITTTGGSTVYGSNDFGLHPIPGINDLQITVSGGPPVPGMNRYYYLNYRNVGTSMLSGSIDFTHDALMNYVSTSPVAGSYNAGTRTVNVPFTNMSPGQSLYQYVVLNAPTSLALGTPVTHYATVNPIPGDTTPFDNLDTLTRITVASYDPNDKMAFHDGQLTDSLIANGTRLDYQVRFQNTGTYYATDVIIRDTLDTDLDVSTLDVNGWSHPMNWALSQERILTFSFMNIMLPDSGLDEPGSHGFVRYSISPNSGLADGTTLLNTAAIYFDFNAPVITNTQYNEIEIPVVSVDAGKEGWVNAYPNPAGQTVNFSGSVFEQGNASLRVFDLQGKEVFFRESKGETTVVMDRGSLKSGLYLWTIEGNDGRKVSGKILFY